MQRVGFFGLRRGTKESDITKVEVPFDGSVEDLRRYVLRFCKELYNWPDTIALSGGLDRTEEGLRLQIVERRPATDDERRAYGIPDSVENARTDGEVVGSIEIVRINPHRANLICKSVSADCQRFMDALVQKIETQKLNAGDVFRRGPMASDRQAEPQADSGMVNEPQSVVTEAITLDTTPEAFEQWLRSYHRSQHPSHEPSAWHTDGSGGLRIYYHAPPDRRICFEATIPEAGKMTITKMTYPRHWKDYFEELIEAVRRQWLSASLPQADSDAVSEQAMAAEDEEGKKPGPTDRLAFEMGQIYSDKTIQVEEERQEPAPPIPRLTWTLVALLFLDFCLFILWGWCLIGDQPNLMAYLQTVFTIAGVPAAILGIVFIAGRPVILEDGLRRLGTDAKWPCAVLIVTGLSIVVTCLFWPLGWIGKCVPAPTSRLTGIAQATPTSRATEVIVVAPTTTATPIVTVTPALTNQSSTVEPNTIGDIFPMFIGSTWSYNFGKVTQATDEEGSRILQFIGSYTETVVAIETGLSDKAKIIGVEITGESFMNHCAGDDFISGDLDTWYVLDDSRLFQLCSRDEASAVATEMVRGQTQATPSVLPEYVAPFEVGKLWPAFPDTAPREDTCYQWHVESKVDVRVPAGEFKDCYRLLLCTLPDTVIRWVCPGVGLVAVEYHHHGSIEEYRAELESFQSHP